MTPTVPPTPSPGSFSREGAGSRLLLAFVAAVPIVVVVLWLLVMRRDVRGGWLLGVLLLAFLLGVTLLRQREDVVGDRAMESWACSAGWVAVPDGRTPLERWPGLAAAMDRARRPRIPSVVDQWRLPPFGVPYGAVVRAVYRGRHRGYSAIALEYALSGGVPLRATQLRYHVVALDLPRVVPTVWLAPRASDPPDVAAGREVLFESVEFNDAWRVTGDDAQFVHAVVSPLVMTRLLSPDALGSDVRFEAASLVHWRLGYGPADPARTEQALDLLADVGDAVPPFVWQQ